MPAANPTLGRPSPFILHTLSFNCLGPINALTGQALASAVWSSANRCLFFPFYLEQPRTFQGALWANGAAVSGNVNVAVYDATGARQATTGSVAQSGTSAMQSAAFSGGAVTLAAGF